MYKILICIFLISCSTSSVTRFNRVKIGMDKTMVLDKLGSPIISERKNGIDIWKYRFFDQGIKVYREIQLKDNQVIYTGHLSNKAKPKLIKELDQELKKLAPKKGDFKEVD